MPYENLKLTNDCPTVKSFTQLIFTVSVVKSMVVVVDVSVVVVDTVVVVSVLVVEEMEVVVTVSVVDDAVVLVFVVVVLETLVLVSVAVVVLVDWTITLYLATLNLKSSYPAAHDSTLRI